MVGIYVIISPDKKVYVGQSRDIERRFYDHKCLRCAYKSTLWRSLTNEGIKNHSFIIVKEFAVDVDQKILNDAEIEYWLYYQEQGYEMLNDDYPGKVSISNCPVYQYDKEGNFIKGWSSANQAGRELNINAAGICKVARGEMKRAGGFIWLRTKHEKITEFKYKNFILKIT